jgi:hypothetical protein
MPNPTNREDSGKMNLPTSQEVTDLRTLEAIADATTGDNPWMSMSAVLALFDDSEDARHWLVRAGDNGWVRTSNNMVAARRLTPDGKAIVETARERRNAVGARRRILQRRLLDWASSKAATTTDTVPLTEFPGSRHSWFEGILFGNDEVWEAVDYLEEQDLVHTIRGMSFGGIAVGITHKGRDCATDYDSDIAAYEAAQRPSAAGHSFTITGDGNALSVAFEPNATAMASAGSVNLDAAAELAKAAREAKTIVNFGDDAEITLTEIESRDPVKVKRGLERLRDLGADTTAGALGNLISTAAIGLLALLS